VTTQTNSLDALTLFRKNPEAFDLVITDMTMPNMTGDILAQKMMSVRPDIPIIVCTGYSERINKKKVKEMGIKELALKPVVMQDIADMIRRTLDDTRADSRETSRSA
jgi:YesN/AraC family two-component response regulator